MKFEEIWDWIRNVDGDGGWVFQIFAVVFFVLLFNFIMGIVLNRLHRKLEKTHNPWDDAFVDALRKPMLILIWIVGISFAAEIVYRVSEAEIFEAAGPIRDVGVIICIAWFLVRLIKRVETNIVASCEKEGKEIDHTTVDVLAKLIRLSVIITSTLVVMQTLGFNISGVLAFGGIGGIAVGFAAKDLLANFFGGLMLYLDRPFTVGDWIRSPDRQIEGTVEKIGWRLTKIITFDKRPLYVPNSAFANIAVENPSRMSHRRIYETIGVRYDDASCIGKIVEDVKTMLNAHPEIDQSQTMIVNFNSFAPSSLDFFVYTFTRTTKWVYYHEVKQDVLLKILEIIKSNNAEVAFPTSTIHVPNEILLNNQA